MALAGTLELQMYANVAKLATDMNQAKKIVGDTANQMRSTLSGLQSIFGAVGIGIGTIFSIDTVRSTIDMLDHLNDLSKSTGLTVEQLAGLKVAAKSSGTDLDGLAGVINKLSVNMGKDPEKFAALGVTAKEPLEAFKQIADVFVGIEDVTLRNATMAALLGKSWMVAAPALAEGGARFGELVEKGTQWSGVNQYLTQQADEFNDKLVFLTGTGSLLVGIFGPLLPLLNTLADEILNAKSNTDGLTSSTSWLLEFFKIGIVRISDIAFEFRQLGIAGAFAASRVSSFFKTDFDWKSPITSTAMAIAKTIRGEDVVSDPAVSMASYTEQRAKARAELDAFQAKVKATGIPSAANTILPEKPKPNPALAAAARAMLDKEKEDKAGQRAAERAAEQAAKALEKLNEDKIKRAFDVEKSALQKRMTLLDLHHANGLVSERDYWDQKLELARSEANAEMKFMDALIARQEIVRNTAQSTKGVNSKEYFDAVNAIEESTKKRGEVESKLGITTQTMFFNSAKAAESYRKSIADVETQIMALQGNTQEVAERQFDASHKDLLEKAYLNQQLDKGEAYRKIIQLRELTLAEKQAATEKSNIDARQSLEATRISRLVKTGQLSEMQGLQQLSDANAAAAARMQPLVDDAQKMADQTPNEANILKVDQLREAMEKLRSESNLVGDKFKEIFSGALTTGIDTFIDSMNKGLGIMTSMRNAAKSFGDSILKEMNNIATKEIASTLSNALGFGKKDGAGGGIASLFGMGPGAGGGFEGLKKLFGFGDVAQNQMKEGGGLFGQGGITGWISSFFGGTKNALGKPIVDDQLSRVAGGLGGGGATAALQSLAASALEASTALRMVSSSTGINGMGSMSGFNLGGLLGGDPFGGGNASYAADIMSAGGVGDAVIASGFMAEGGVATGGKSYIVGEKGPELFTPGSSGYITPNGKFGGGNVINVSFNINGQVDTRTQAQMAAAAGQAVSRSMKRNT